MRASGRVRIEAVYPAAEHPDVVFLAEALTRPTVMRTLAKVGFTPPADEPAPVFAIRR